MTQLEIKKDIKGFDLIFNLNDDLTNIGDAREAYIELNKVFLISIIKIKLIIEEYR